MGAALHLVARPFDLGARGWRRAGKPAGNLVAHFVQFIGGFDGRPLRLVGKIRESLVTLVECLSRGVTDPIERLDNGVLHVFGGVADFVFVIDH
ncbi:MAG TPA: hypothetical protein VK550_25135 [Polyangiaceae bacterium]|jgi:hypothetical protein|nr:hypothetical protein [Polyangiaceae bacterium]